MLRGNINLTLHAASLHPQILNSQLSILNSRKMNKNELWQKILHIAITILTAIATTFGVTSCMGV